MNLLTQDLPDATPSTASSGPACIAGEASPPTRHLRALEAEGVHILREVAGQARSPVMLYSIGKDSTVLLHLAQKAFFPGRLPFPILHIDTRWKFRDMIAFRSETVRRFNLDLRVHTNEEGVRLGVNPIDTDSVTYNQLMKTDALKQALTAGDYDFAVGGARRDEERSRAKERIFSIRAPGQVWDPKRQRPELWRLYNGQLAPNETMRVFPLSNWTELDVWSYIRLERIAVVPLYFAALRPTVERQGRLIVVDDERLRPAAGEPVVHRRVRFRSLGCYPLTAAIPSDAETVDDIIREMRTTRLSERAGRLIDSDQEASMERKKRDGYF